MPGKLVVALDFSDVGRGALDAAMALAKDLRASLVLVHSFRRAFMSPDLPAPGLSVAATVPDLEARMERSDAIALSTEWAGLARAAGLNVETETSQSDPGHAAIEAARRHDALLIVVGTHGRTGLNRFLSGSVSEWVVRHADRPVLVVPHKSP